jgi:hypothetical protein
MTFDPPIVGLSQNSSSVLQDESLRQSCIRYCSASSRLFSTRSRSLDIFRDKRSPLKKESPSSFLNISVSHYLFCGSPCIFHGSRIPDLSVFPPDLPTSAANLSIFPLYLPARSVLCIFPEYSCVSFESPVRPSDFPVSPMNFTSQIFLYRPRISVYY